VQYIGAGPVISIHAAAILLIAMAACYRFGRSALAFFPIPEMTRTETFLFSVGLGFAALSLGIFLLGIMGFLTRPAILILSGIFIVSPFLICRIVNAPGGAEAKNLRRGLLSEESVLWTLMAAVFFLSLVQALAPCTGVDALAYHLYLPKEFLRLGQIVFLPLTRESLWPFNTEMLFMAGLLFQGTAAAQLFHWVFYPLTGWAIYLCTRRYYGEKTAAWAACFFIFTPAAFAQSGYPYVDLSLAFFVFLSVYAFLIAGTSAAPAAYALAGLFCGAAMGVKFLGLGCLMILFPMVLWQSRFSLKKSALFLAAVFFTGGGWYVRSWILSGNPVYPLFPHFFGRHGWSIQMDEGVSMGKNLAAFLFFPWNVTMFPNAFGGQMIGAIFLILMPVLFVERRRPQPFSRYLVFFGFGYVVFLFTQSQHVRFFIAVAPFLSIGAAIAFMRLVSGGKFLRSVAVTITAALLVLHMGIFVYRLRDAWSVVLGKVSAEAWLIDHERSFRGFDYLRSHAKPGEKILNAAEVRYFYAQDSLNITHLPQENVRLRKLGLKLQDLLETEKFDYVWAVEPFDPALQTYLKDKGYRVAYSYEFTEKPDIFRNSIYHKPSQA